MAVANRPPPSARLQVPVMDHRLSSEWRRQCDVSSLRRTGAGWLCHRRALFGAVGQTCRRSSNVSEREGSGRNSVGILQSVAENLFQRVEASDEQAMRAAPPLSIPNLLGF